METYVFAKHILYVWEINEWIERQTNKFYEAIINKGILENKFKV